MNGKSAAVGCLFLAVSGLLGCARGDSKGMGGAPDVTADGTRTSSHTFAFGGAGVKAASHVDRVVRPDGSEVLRGWTEVTLPASAHPYVIVENAEIDATGRLSLATTELRTGPQANEKVRSVHLDAERGTVAVRDASGERSWKVAADQPWIYSELFSDIAPPLSAATAVQGWVARRAAQSSAKVRNIDVATQRAHRTPADQVVFEDGPSVWVVLGEEAIETDAGFVRALPWKSLEAASAERRAAELSCNPGPA